MTGKKIVKDAEHNTKTSYTADITSGYNKDMSLYMLPSPAGSYTPTGLYNLSLHPNHSLTGKRYNSTFFHHKTFHF